MMQTQLNNIRICHVHQEKLDALSHKTNLSEPSWVKWRMPPGIWIIYLDDTFPSPPLAALSVAAVPLHILTPFFHPENNTSNTAYCTPLTLKPTLHICKNNYNCRDIFFCLFVLSSVAFCKSGEIAQTIRSILMTLCSVLVFLSEVTKKIHWLVNRGCYSDQLKTQTLKSRI